MELPWGRKRLERRVTELVKEQRILDEIEGYWPDASESGRVASVSRALSVVPVLGAARLLADLVASLTPVLYTTDERGIPVRQPTPSLFAQPSIHGTLYDWLFRAVFSMAIQGDAIGLVTTRDYYGFPTMIEWLNPEQVATQDGKLYGPGSYMKPMWWWWGRPVDPRNLIHIPWFTLPWRVRGLSPIGAYQLTTDINISAREYSANWFGQGGVPPGILKNQFKTFDFEEGERLANRFVARLRTRKPIVHGSDWDYTPIAIKPHEAEFINTLRLTATDIAVIYGLPPEKLGGTTGNSLTYCADTETEILTQRGWLRYNQVTTDDICLTLNVDTGMSEWQPVQRVNIFEGEHDVVKLENSSHSSVTTPNHRWPIMMSDYQPTAGWRFTTTARMQSGARVCAAAPIVAGSGDVKWSDDYVELMAWFWTEGHVNSHGSVVITQSSKVNADKVERIRSALCGVFGPPLEDLRGVRSPAWRMWTEERGITRFYLNTYAGYELTVSAPKKVVSVSFLSELTRAQLELFVRTSIDADGNWRPGESDSGVLCQRDRARLDAFQIACTLAGKAGVIRQNAMGMWTMCITKSAWRKPAGHRQYVTRDKTNTVWCPTTENKTWFARRNGTVYATGNSTVELNTIDMLTNTARPWLRRFEYALTRCFPRNYFVKFDVNDMLLLDAKTRAIVDSTSLGFQNQGWKDRDEVRAGYDLPPQQKPNQAPAKPTTPANADDLNPDDNKTGQPNLNGNGGHGNISGTNNHLSGTRAKIEQLEKVKARNGRMAVIELMRVKEPGSTLDTGFMRDRVKT